MTDGDPEKRVVHCFAWTGQGQARDLIPLANETKSRIQVSGWLRQTLAANVLEGTVTGPAFCDEKGVVLTTPRVVSEVLHKALEGTQVMHKTLFLGDILS